MAEPQRPESNVCFVLTTTFAGLQFRKRNSLPGQPFIECEDVAQKPKAGFLLKKNFFFPEVDLILLSVRAELSCSSQSTDPVFLMAYSFADMFRVYKIT